MVSVEIKCSECLEFLRALPDNSVDLTFCSPPYEAARKYGELGFKLRGQQWVDWAVERYVECCRVTKGLVAWVVEGQTRKFQRSATPALLMADLHRRGVKLRKPPAFHRVGVCGSGGPDWWRNDYEFVVCASKGRLPWSDSVATGAPPKHRPGGAMSNRGGKDSRRGRMAASATEPKTIAFLDGRMPAGSKLHTKNNGTSMRVQCYTPPEIANPGNVVSCSVGGGRMGSVIAHDNEAPFPEKLADAFIRSFCPPSGTVLDCFGGSGTTLAVAVLNDRNAISVDIRESQCELMRRRLAEAGERKLLKDAAAQLAEATA